MIALTKDLFPETLLVNIKNGRSYTTSLLVAEHFHKRHDHVVRDVEKLIKKLEAAQISLPNFEESDCANASLPLPKIGERKEAPTRSEVSPLSNARKTARVEPTSLPLLKIEERKTNYQTGKKQAQTREVTYYEMDRDAFVLLVMGYTGAKALQWKIDFIHAFNAMEQYIHLEQQRRAAALQRIRPHWITIEQADREGLSRAEIAKLTGHKSLASITANRARMREVGLPCRPLPQRKSETTH